MSTLFITDVLTKIENAINKQGGVGAAPYGPPAPGASPSIADQIGNWLINPLGKTIEGANNLGDELKNHSGMAILILGGIIFLGITILKWFIKK